MQTAIRFVNQTPARLLMAAFTLGVVAPAFSQDFPHDRVRDRWDDRDGRRDDHVGFDTVDETFLSRNVNLSVSGPNRLLNLTRLIDGRARGAMMNNLILVAASRRGVGQVELVLNGQTITAAQVPQNLGAVEFRINRVLGQDVRSIELRTNGRIRIASIGVTLEGDLGIDPNDPWDPIDGPVDPLPPPPPAREDIVVTELIRGIFEGGRFSDDRAIAQRDYDARCAQWKSEQEKLLGNRIRELSCGTLEEKGGNDGYRFESLGRVVFVSYAPVKTLELPISGIFEGGRFSDDRAIALNDYTARCQRLRSELIDQSRVPLLYFSCGTLADTGGNSGFRYESVAKVMIDESLPLRSQTARVSGVFEGGRFSDDRAIALRSYEQKCTEWKNDVLRYNAGRAVLVTCGKLVDVGGDGGFLYQSDATAVLIDE